MCRLYREGKTQQAISSVFGVTRQRVQQCLKERGLGKDDGGQKVRANLRTQAYLARLDARSMKIHGLPKEAWREIRAKYGMKPFRAFHDQRFNSAKRGIAFRLTFAEWWKVWADSGKWDKRGRARDRYVMSRPGDVGAYEVGNVMIKTLSENFNEYHQRAGHSLRVAGAGIEPA